MDLTLICYELLTPIICATD